MTVEEENREGNNLMLDEECHLQRKYSDRPPTTIYYVEGELCMAEH